MYLNSTLRFFTTALFLILVTKANAQTKLYWNGEEVAFFDGVADISKAYGDSDFTLNLSSNSSGKIKLTANNDVISLSGADKQTVSIHKAGFAKVNITIEASGTYKEASYTLGIFVTKIPPVISGVPEQITKTYGDPSFALNATSNSSGKITYRIIPPTISGIPNDELSLSGTNKNVVTIHKASDFGITIRVSTAEDENFFSGSKDITINVKRAPLTMTISDVAIKCGDSNPTDNISFKGFVNGDTEADLGVTRSGMITYFNYKNQIRAKITFTSRVYTDRKYEIIANTATHSILKQAQTIEFAPLPKTAFIETTYSIGLNAKASSDESVTYTSSNPNVAEISENILKIKGVGVATITALQGGSICYNAAPKVSQTIEVKAGVPKINLVWDGKTVNTGQTLDLGIAKKDIADNYKLVASIKLANKGTATLSHQVKVTGEDAALFKTFIHNSTAPGKNRTLVVTYQPADVEERKAEITLTSNDPTAKTITFLVKASAKAPIIQVKQANQAISQGSGAFDFGEVMREKEITFAIKNTGNESLYLDDSFAFTIDGTHSRDFTVTSTPSSLEGIAAGTEKTFVVRFRPSSKGVKNARLGIRSNALHFRSFSFVLRGTGNSEITALPLIPSSQNDIIKVGPNPVVDYLKIQLPKQKQSEVIYELISAQGKMLIQGNESIENNDLIIDLNGIPAGTYLLRLVLGKELIMHRVVKP